MVITEIKPQKGHLQKIAFDNESFVLLERDFFILQGLKLGDRLTQEKLNELLEESEYIRAKNRALWFLDRAPRSEKTLYEKIVSGNISATAAARAVARLKELGLVDDRKYAENMAERFMEQNISKRSAFAKMMTKGLPVSIIKETLAETPSDEVAQVKAVIDKKYKNRLDTKENVAKTVAALLRRGFSYQSVRTAMKEYKTELEYGDY